MSFVSFPEFPESKNDPFLKTSPQSRSYNCIAWAYGDNTRWYWPDPYNIYYWHPELPREENLDNFISLFKIKGYELCNSGTFEKGYIKIAIFCDKNNEPTHAAKQLENGYWSSKLGENIDVQHTIKSIENGIYGNVKVFMKKKA